MSHIANPFSPEGGKRTNAASVYHLAHMWAKKYVQNLHSIDDTYATPTVGITQTDTARVSATDTVRIHTAKKLNESLRTASIKSWSNTEKLISKEIRRHQIQHSLIDPWQISEDSFRVYQKTIEIYVEQASPQHLSRIISPSLGRIRQQYTSVDPRVIAFVALQFHYTGQNLLQQISEWERDRVASYFKVIDDHLYMPLQRAYQAAANHELSSPTLQAVQRLLPMSTDIATKVCDRVIDLYPNYYTYSGALNSNRVRTASIRDTEMFQVYLWVCVLEGNISCIQQELFPLCVMLYPTLKVRWELIRQMIHLLGQEILIRLGAKQQQIFMPYCQALWEMFSPEVFPESLDDYSMAL